MKFCPRCGATDKDFYKGFCIDCYSEINEFAKIPSKMKISKCKNCGFWFYKKSLVEDSYQNLVKIISENVKTTLFNPKFDADFKDENIVLFELSGFADERRGIPIKIKREIPIVFETKTCRSCQKFNAQNYEVKIQLRRSGLFDVMKYKKISDYIRKETNYFMRKDEKARAFWIEEKKEGIDFLFGFKKIGDQILHKVLTNFKVDHEPSSQFLGLDRSGKKKIRATHCLRI
jgi:NMD protein affecting ribosome stability and mRNA decay